MHNIMLWTLQDGLHILRTDDILVFPSMIIVCTDYTLFFFFFFFFFFFIRVSPISILVLFLVFYSILA